MQPGLLERSAAGFIGQVAGRGAGFGDVPLLDAGAGRDPFVGGFDQPLKVCVR